MKCMHRVMAFGRFYQDHFTSTKQSVRSPGALEERRRTLQSKGLGSVDALEAMSSPVMGQLVGYPNRSPSTSYRVRWYHAFGF